MFRAVIDLESAYKVFSWKGNKERRFQILKKKGPESQSLKIKCSNSISSFTTTALGSLFAGFSFLLPSASLMHPLFPHHTFDFIFFYQDSLLVSLQKMLQNQPSNITDSLSRASQETPSSQIAGRLFNKLSIRIQSHCSSLSLIDKFYNSGTCQACLQGAE